MPGVVVAPMFVGLVLLWWLQRRTASNAYVLAVLPLTLFAVVAGMYREASNMINAFVGIAETGLGRDLIAAQSAAMTQTLVFGVSLCPLGTISAGALQAWTAFQEPPAELDPDTPPDARWKTWALPATSVAIVPVAFLLHNTARIAYLMSIIADPVRSEDAALTYAAGLVGSDSVGALSSRLSAGLVITAVGGLAATSVLLLLGVFNIVLVGTRSVPRRETGYSWVVFGVLCLSASVTLVLLNR